MIVDKEALIIEGKHLYKEYMSATGNCDYDDPVSYKHMVKSIHNWQKFLTDHPEISGSKDYGKILAAELEGLKS